MLNCNSDDEENIEKNTAAAKDLHIVEDTKREARSLLGNIRNLKKSFTTFRSKNKT